MRPGDEMTVAQPEYPPPLDVERPPWWDSDLRPPAPALPQHPGTQWDWAVWIAAGVVALYVAGVWLLPDAAAVLANVVAAAALVLLVLALWQQRRAVRAWSAWIGRMRQHQQTREAHYQAEWDRLRREGQRQLYDLDRRWQDFYCQQRRGLERALEHLVHAEIPAAVSGSPVPKPVADEAVDSLVGAWLTQVAQAATQAAERQQHWASEIARLRVDVQGAAAALQQDASRWTEHVSGVDDRLRTLDDRLQTFGDRLDPLTPAQAGRSGEPERDVFVFIGRRLHALVSRTLEAVTDVEREVEDPDLLHDIFTIDHLVTLTRRVAERLAVLGGEPARRVVKPLPLATVLRQAMAEVEQYSRVQVRLPDTESALKGFAGPDVIHLLAELVENATKFSRPTTTVVMRTALLPAGLAIEVDDRGLGMSTHKLAAVNRLLAAPETVDVHRQVGSGQFGLLAAAELARRHDIQVELRPRDGGGTQARVVLPSTLLVAPDWSIPQSPAHAAAPAPPPNGGQAGTVAAALDSAGPGPTGELTAAHDPPHAPDAEQPGGLPRRRRAAPAHPAVVTGSAAPPAAGAPAPDGARPPLPRRSDAPRLPPREPAAPEHHSVPSRPPTPDLMGDYVAGVRDGSQRTTADEASGRGSPED